MPRKLEKCTILVVDDEEGIRSLVADILNLEGFNYYTAEDGQQAFDRICSTQIDAVISDIRMPNVGGIDLLDKVKSRNLEIPRLALLTGYSDYSIPDIYDRGAEAFLAKPFRLDVLLHLVHKLLIPYGAGWKEPDIKESTLLIAQKFTSLENAQASRSLIFGRGGFFTEWKAGSFPLVGTKVKFRYEFDSKSLKPLVGHGTVRWVRKQAEGTLQPGVGIEFDYLSNDAYTSFIEQLHSTTLRPFIPKGG